MERLWNLIKNVSGLTFINPNLPALKYGRDMEPLAANILFSILKKSHKGLKMEEPGLILDVERPFIGASPDRLVSCLCHGKLCVEIKCPYSISHKSPTDDDIQLPFLQRDEEGSLKLKTSHGWITQCQLQMGVAQLKKMHFFRLYSSWLYNKQHRI